MHRRRIGLAIVLVACAALIAVKPGTGEIRLSLDLPGAGNASRAEAALEVGAIAVSLLIRTAERPAR